MLDSSKKLNTILYIYILLVRLIGPWVRLNILGHYSFSNLDSIAGTDIREFHQFSEALKWLKFIFIRDNTSLE